MAEKKLLKLVWGSNVRVAKPAEGEILPWERLEAGARLEILKAINDGTFYPRDPKAKVEYDERQQAYLVTMTATGWVPGKRDEAGGWTPGTHETAAVTFKATTDDLASCSLALSPMARPTFSRTPYSQAYTQVYNTRIDAL